MHYMSSTDSVKRLNNRRTNAQGDYYTADQFDRIFSQIWLRLHKEDSDLFPAEETLVLNANNGLVKYVLNNRDGEKTPMLCEQLYDLAKLAHGSLSPERMTKFIARSSEIMKEEYGA